MHQQVRREWLIECRGFYALARRFSRSLVWSAGLAGFAVLFSGCALQLPMCKPDEQRTKFEDEQLKLMHQELFLIGDMWRHAKNIQDLRSLAPLPPLVQQPSKP